MTQHVRAGYRNHRKATWALALVLIGVIAAVVIPIASGAADKTYTMQFPTSGAVTPTPPTTGSSTSQQNLCSNSSYTSVKVEISNTAKSVSLGSSDVTFPNNVTVTGVSGTVTGAAGATTAIGGANDVLIQSLSLPTGSKATFSVSLTTGAVGGPSALSAVTKQSNNFNDSGQNPNTNTFSQPNSFPKLNVQDCTATISGKVYLDRNTSGGFNTSGSPSSDVPKAGWTATLFKKTGTSTYTQVGTDTTDSNGDYSFQAQIANDYRVCASAPTGNNSDNNTAWGLLQPTGNSDCGPLSSGSGSTSAGWNFSLSASGATGKDFGVVPVISGFGKDDTATTSDGDYSVTAGSSTTKPDDLYVQQDWTDAGRAYFSFSPLTPCTTNCGQIYLLETLTGTVDQSALSGTQARLFYDDSAPYDTFVEMPYCVNDPRPADWGTGGTGIITTDILPSGTKSCIVTGHQEIVGGATPKVDFTYLVYTTFDGGRGVF